MLKYCEVLRLVNMVLNLAEFSPTWPDTNSATSCDSDHGDSCICKCDRNCSRRSHKYTFALIISWFVSFQCTVGCLTPSISGPWFLRPAGGTRSCYPPVLEYGPYHFEIARQEGHGAVREGLCGAPTYTSLLYPESMSTSYTRSTKAVRGLQDSNRGERVSRGGAPVGLCPSSRRHRKHCRWSSAAGVRWVLSVCWRKERRRGRRPLLTLD